MWISHLERKKMEKAQITFLLLFNELKFYKSPLLCCNGYSHAIFTILFLWISSIISMKSIKKRKKKNNDLFITCLLHFYDLNHLDLWKSRLGGYCVWGIIVTKFQVSTFKTDEVRGGGGYFKPSQRRISWLRM